MRRVAAWWGLLALTAGLGCAAPAPTRRAGAEATAAAEARTRSVQQAQQRAGDRLEQLQQQREAATAAPAAPVNTLGQRYAELLERPGTPEQRKPELLLRLAELAYRAEEDALRAAYESGVEPTAPPGQRYTRSLGYYRELTQRYPDSPQALTAYYNMGYLYAEEGMEQASAQAYAEVLQRDAATPYADEIHMRLGEAHFEAGRPERAAVHYRTVVAGEKPEYVDKAYYKLGWCYYNLEQYAEAVAAFHQVLQRERAAAQGLREETLEVMARSFLEWGGIERLRAYLAARGPHFAHAPQLYLRLGNLYMESSRYLAAVEVYRTAVDDQPAAAECLTMEEGIIRALLILRRQADAMARRETWARRYAPAGPWDEAHRGTDLAHRRDAMVEEGLRLTALYHHAAGQRGEGGLSRALELYRQYLDWFGADSEQGYEVLFSFARALKEAGHLADAAARYGEVARHPQWNAHREDASYRRIEVLERSYRDDPEVLDDLAAAHEMYVELNPDSELVPQVLFAEGELFFAAEQFARARQVFARVAEAFPAHRLHGQALERIARCRFREHAFEQTEGACRRALAAQLDRLSRVRVRKLLAFSIFKQAEALEASGDPAAANHHFFRLADELPEEEAAPIALHRGGKNLRALGREEAAARVYDRLARDYPGTEYGQNARVLSARIFASLGDWPDAARSYEAMFRAEPRAVGAADALFLAAQAWQRAEQSADAVRLYAEFVHVFPGERRVAEAYYQEAMILQVLGREAAARERLHAAWQAEVPTEAAAPRARAALALGRMSLAAFASVRLQGDLAAALERKEVLLTEALGYLAQAASLPFAETFTEASFRAGAAFEDMKTALLESERPQGLNVEELEEYDYLLEEKAFPLEERALSYYRSGVAKAVDAGVYTPWVERMYARLDALMPWAYRRQEQPSTVWDVPPLPQAAAVDAGAGVP